MYVPFIQWHITHCYVSGLSYLILLIFKYIKQMRTILFRGQSKFTTHKWLYGSYLILGDKHYILPIDDKMLCNYEVIPETVCQFTGLIDKNGLKIFEGDIYHQGDNNITYTVIWNECGIIGKQNGTSSFAGINYWIDRIEVVGNIYDNPELLQ